jgi:hypothetical protein
MFVQVYNEDGAILFPAISPELRNASFSHLLASEGVAVSGKLENGRIVQIMAHSPEAKEWTCMIPASLAKHVKFNAKLTSSKGQTGKYALIHCKLEKGDNLLTQ